MITHRLIRVGCLLACCLSPAAAGHLWGQAASRPRPVYTGPRPFSLELRFSSVFDSNIDHDQDDLDSFGGQAALRARLQTKGWRPLFALEYQGSVQAYTQSDRWDRVTHNARATLSGRAGDLRLSATGELSTRALTEDREIANQYTVRPTIAYDLGGAVRISVYGAHRIRRLPDTPERNEAIWYAGSELRVNLWDGGRWEVGYRYESSDSETLDRRYDRQRYSAEFRTTLGGQTELRLDMEYRPRAFSDLLIDADGVDVPREDRRWIPSASLTYRFAGEHWLRMDYEFERRISNDLAKEYDAHRFTLTLRWALVGRRR